jgi:uncharacterized protein (DUF983 family)
VPDSLTSRWEPPRRARPVAWPVPRLPVAMARGAAGRCPACGKSPLFRGWLRVSEACPVCTAPLGTVRADDAPPYVVVFVVAHVIVTAMVLTERMTAISMLLEALIFLPLTALLAAILLRPVKGALVGLLLVLGLAGEAPDPG